MTEAKIQEKISKLEAANGALGVKVAVNKTRIRALIGKLAGVAAGDIVVVSGQRYKVAEILSETAPKKGKPSISGFKIARNGNVAKRAVEIKGAWAPEGAVAVVKATGKKPGPKAKAVAKAPAKAAAPAKRRLGRPSKKALEGIEFLGTA